MLLPSFVTALALVFYAVTIVNVGRARAKYGMKPPSIAGNDAFERAFRVQQNTVEQMMLFLPTLWLHTIFIGPQIASAFGALWLIGRVLYARGYYQSAEKRMVGFIMTMGASTLLLFGALGGIIYRFAVLL